MSLTRRLAKIETRLTPKQAVLYWLKEARESFKDFAAYYTTELAAGPALANLPTKIPDKVAQAVRESLRWKKSDEDIARFELEARRQTNFLLLLLISLNAELSSSISKDWLRIQLLREQHFAMAHQYKEHGLFDREEWEWWRKTLIVILCRLWRQKATTEVVSLRYYDGSGILFDKQESELQDCIATAERLAKLYNVNRRRARTLPVIDLAAVRHSTELEVPAALRELVNPVWSTCW
jgi:hypothetical protein